MIIPNFLVSPQFQVFGAVVLQICLRKQRKFSHFLLLSQLSAKKRQRRWMCQRSLKLLHKLNQKYLSKHWLKIMFNLGPKKQRRRNLSLDKKRLKMSNRLIFQQHSIRKSLRNIESNTSFSKRCRRGHKASKLDLIKCLSSQLLLRRLRCQC